MSTRSWTRGRTYTIGAFWLVVLPHSTWYSVRILGRTRRLQSPSDSVVTAVRVSAPRYGLATTITCWPPAGPPDTLPESSTLPPRTVLRTLAEIDTDRPAATLRTTIVPFIVVLVRS